VHLRLRLRVRFSVNCFSIESFDPPVTEQSFGPLGKSESITLCDDRIYLLLLQGNIYSFPSVYPYQVLYLYPAEPRMHLSVSFSPTEASVESDQFVFYHQPVI
jgi:hypothetical protein